MLKRDSDTGNVGKRLQAILTDDVLIVATQGLAGEVLEHLESAVGREAVVVVCFCALCSSSVDSL